MSPRFRFCSNSTWSNLSTCETLSFYLQLSFPLSPVWNSPSKQSPQSILSPFLLPMHLELHPWLDPRSDIHVNPKYSKTYVRSLIFNFNFFFWSPQWDFNHWSWWWFWHLWDCCCYFSTFEWLFSNPWCSFKFWEFLWVLHQLLKRDVFFQHFWLQQWCTRLNCHNFFFEVFWVHL